MKQAMLISFNAWSTFSWGAKVPNLRVLRRIRKKEAEDRLLRWVIRGASLEDLYQEAASQWTHLSNNQEKGEKEDDKMD